MELVIKGATYYERELNEIIIPMHTGVFRSVDCEAYLTKEKLKGKGYSEEYIRGVKENYITRNGIKYFYSGYTPYHIDEDFELMSDLSELVFEEESRDFYN